MAELTLIISGMTCGGCVASVTRVLQASPGVRQVTVSLVPSRAVVDYDPDNVTPNQLATAVQDAGFSVTETKF